MNHWKWLGSNERYIGQSGPEYWFDQLNKMKPSYDCQAMYLRDAQQYGKWVAMPCYSSAPFVCEYRIAPPGSPEPSNPSETLAMMDMMKSSPAYLQNTGYSKGNFVFSPPTKGSYMSAYMKG